MGYFFSVSQTPALSERLQQINEPFLYKYLLLIDPYLVVIILR